MAEVGPLVVRIVSAAGVPGGKALALCTEDGQVLGKQISTAVDCEATDISTITVRFYIDGKLIRFASNDD
jgi:hypothetical protein